MRLFQQERQVVERLLLQEPTARGEKVEEDEQGATTESVSISKHICGIQVEHHRTLCRRGMCRIEVAGKDKIQEQVEAFVIVVLLCKHL